MDKTDVWADRFPPGIGEFASTFSNRKRLAIAAVLMEKGPMRFSEIRVELGLQSNLLTKHLKTMMRDGTLQMIDVSIDGEKKVNYRYDLYPFDKHLLTTISEEIEHGLQSPRPVNSWFSQPVMGNEVSLAWQNSNGIERPYVQIDEEMDIKKTLKCMIGE